MKRGKIKIFCLLACFLMIMGTCTVTYADIYDIESDATEAQAGSEAGSDSGQQTGEAVGSGAGEGSAETVGSAETGSSTHESASEPTAEDESAGEGLSEEILQMIDETNIAPIEDDYDESYIVSMRVPTKVIFMIDPYDMLGNGTVSSTVIPIENKSDFAVDFSIDTVEVSFGHEEIELSRNPVDQDSDYRKKVIEIKMVWIDSEGNQEERLVSGAPEESAYAKRLEAGEKVEFYITGSLNSNPKKAWRNDDIELNFTVNMDKAAEPVVEEPAEPSEEPVDVPASESADATEPAVKPEPQQKAENIYSINNDSGQ